MNLLETWIKEIQNFSGKITPNQINILLIISLVIFMIIIIIIIKRRKGDKYEFEICIMKDGMNIWETVNRKTLDWKYKSKYEITPDCLYTVEMDPRLRLHQWISRIKTSFIVVFREDKPEGIVYGDPDRSAYVLKVVEESKALGLALKEEFKQAMTFKRIFILVVLAIVIGVVYMVITGQVTI